MDISEQLFGMPVENIRTMVEESIGYKIAKDAQTDFVSYREREMERAARNIVVSMASDLQEEIARGALVPDDIRRRLNVFKFILTEYA